MKNDTLNSNCPKLIVVLLFCVSCLPLSAQQLPTNPDPNKCYVRCVTIEERDTIMDEILTYSAEDALKYPHREKYMVTKPEIRRYEVLVDHDCEPVRPNDCQVLCLKEEPEEGFVYYKPKKKSLGEPHWRPFERIVIIQEGGLSSYEEVDCELTSYNVLPNTLLADFEVLSAEDRKIIDERLLTLMEDQPNIRIQINAHTSSVGSAAHNLVVSERRAQAIADYLISRGIQPGRIVTIGYGESQLKNRCADGVRCSEEEHAANRRIEFRVLSVDM